MNNSLECSDGYTLNPHSQTCYALYNDLLTKAEAEQFCRSLGEHLATFLTLESALWLQEQQLNNPSEYSVKGLSQPVTELPFLYEDQGMVALSVRHETVHVQKA